MLLNIIFFTILTIFAKTPEQKKKAAEAACKSYSTVELVASDKEANKIKPQNSIVAKEMRERGLVPIKSVVVFMRPDSEYPLCGMPENLLLIHKKLVESIGENQAAGGKNFTLIKGVLGNLIGNSQSEEEEGEGEEGEGEEDHAEAA